MSRGCAGDKQQSLSLSFRWLDDETFPQRSHVRNAASKTFASNRQVDGCSSTNKCSLISAICPTGLPSSDGHSTVISARFGLW